MQPLPKPPQTKHVELILLGVLAVVAFLYAVLTLDKVNRAERSAAAAAHWVLTPATLVRTELVTPPGRNRGVYTRVWYAYEFAGKRYESSRENFITRDETTSQDVFEIQRRASAGTFSVYVHPTDPARAVVRRAYQSPDQIQRLRRFSYSLLGFAAASLVVIPWSLRRNKKRPSAA